MKAQSKKMAGALHMLSAGYRAKLLIEEVMVFPNGCTYYVCHRCGVTLIGSLCPSEIAAASVWVGKVTEKPGSSIPPAQKDYSPESKPPWWRYASTMVCSCPSFDAYETVNMGRNELKHSAHSTWR